MNHHLHDAATVGARASIIDVRQLVVTANLRRVTEAPLHADVDHTFDWRLEDAVLLCEVGCEVRITERESGDEVFDATVVYGCGFAIRDLDGLEEDAYEEFVKVNATLCLHPYIREAVQSLTSRAGLPPLVLGTFRVPVAIAAESERKAGVPSVASVETADPPEASGDTGKRGKSAAGAKPPTRGKGRKSPGRQ